MQTNIKTKKIYIFYNSCRFFVNLINVAIVFVFISLTVDKVYLANTLPKGYQILYQ